MEINGQIIGNGHPPYVIAEVGINHNGSLSRAKEMIEIAAEAGADAVKFQTFKAEEFCGDENQMFTYQSQGREVTESMLKMFKRVELPEDAWLEIKAHADLVGITFFSSPQNITDLNVLLNVGVPAIKVGSDDLTNLPLIRHYSSVGLPLILSSGMSTVGEVHSALDASGWYEGRQVAVLVCTSQYPTPIEDINILRVATLQQAFPGLIVGFSDHTSTDLATSMAVALGGNIFEKHFTISHDDPGPDHWFSLDRTQLSVWVKTIRDSYISRGTGIFTPTEQELSMRVLARRSVVAAEDIPRGTVILDSMLKVARPGDGLPPHFLNYVSTRIARRDISRGKAIQLEDI